MDFPMQPRERKVFEESQQISNKVYCNEMSILEGVKLMRDVLEQVLGKENIEVCAYSAWVNCAQNSAAFPM